jgi:thiol-disulfide isomerase/thioredoxin/tetratricopeptide (TPR) repeat protein
MIAATLLFFMASSPALAGKKTVSGVVLDAAGKPVAGAQVARFWGSQKGAMKPFDEATTDDRGQFALGIDNYGHPTALLAIDDEQEHGQLAILDASSLGRPLTLRLQPLITLRGEFFCEELDEAPSWSNVYINVTTNRIRLAEDDSVPSKFELKLPPGEYEISGYGNEEVRGTNRHVTLSVDTPVTNLGRINLAATPIGLHWGKPAPSWNITEARGVGTNVTLADFRGKWLLLDFWGYWCGPCVQSMPDLMKFYDRHAADRGRFEILAIHNGADSLRDMDEKLKPTVKGLWKGRALPFPVIVDATKKSTDNYGIQGFPTQVLIDPGGRIVRDGEESLLESILDTQRKQIMPVALSSDGSRLAIVGTNSTVRVMETATDKELVTLKGHDGAVNCAAFFADGRRMVTGGADHTVRLWDLFTGKELAKLVGHQGPIFAVAVSPDGKTLASAGFDTLRLWDVGTGREIEAFKQQLFPSWSVAFSPDGRQVAAGGVGTVKVWDASTGEEKASLRDAHTDIIYSVAFSPDGRTLAAGRGKTVVLWNIATAKRQIELKGHGSDVVSVAFSPDGKTVTAVSRGKGLRSWSRINGAEESPAQGSTHERGQRVAAHLPDDAGALNSEAWEVVQRITQPSALYERALRQAQIAARNSPQTKAYLRTLGAAEYRVGAFSNAVAILTRAETIKDDEGEDRWAPPVGLLFRTMALQKQGETRSALEIALTLWSCWWDPQADATKVFNEMNETLFGVDAEAARVLVLKLLAAGKTPSAVQSAIKANAKLNEDVLQTALRMVPVAEVFHLVRKEQKNLLLRERVVRAVERLESLTDEQRKLALTLAGKTKEDAYELNDASWDVVREPGRTGADYELALAQAEAAYRLNQSDDMRNTLGVAQYRAGKYQEAIEMLIKSERASSDGIAARDDLPFLAMAFYKAEKPVEAKKRFDQLARILAQSQTKDEEMVAWSHEVESVFGVKLQSNPPQ